MITPDAAGNALLESALKGAVYDCPKGSRLLVQLSQ
jgi:hypothetical protein